MRASRFELAVAHPSPHLKRMLLPLTPAMRDPDCHQRSPRLLATVHMIRIHLLQTLLCLSIGLGSALALASETVKSIHTRGQLRCGVSEGIPGFSSRDAAGRWSGLDVDLCRAVAAAVLGDPARITFVPLKASARSPALKALLTSLKR